MSRFVQFENAKDEGAYAVYLMSEEGCERTARFEYDAATTTLAGLREQSEAMMSAYRTAEAWAKETGAAVETRW